MRKYFVYARCKIRGISQGCQSVNITVAHINHAWAYIFLNYLFFIAIDCISGLWFRKTLILTEQETPVRRRFITLKRWEPMGNRYSYMFVSTCSYTGDFSKHYWPINFISTQNMGSGLQLAKYPDPWVSCSHHIVCAVISSPASRDDEDFDKTVQCHKEYDVACFRYHLGDSQSFKNMYMAW